MPRPTLLARLRALPLASLAVALATIPVFLHPGIELARDLADPALRGPGVPRRARDLHALLTPRIEAWARERVASRRAADAPLHDVPTTEWPMFTAVFYLMATEELVRDWERHGRAGPSPAEPARGALEASRDLILDPSHHTWVRTHWGEGYMHTENVFFRSLIIGGLASYERATHDGSTLDVLRDQVETLAAELDASPYGVLEDYPTECYPIDVFAAIGWIRRADEVLGTDHADFVARSIRAFEGPMEDELGLVPFRMDAPTAIQVQPGRGIGTSWILLFARDLYGPERAERWYRTYEAHFWQERAWAHGFREWARGSAPEWGFEIDAGPVLDGFGTSASAFGIGAARREGRFDHAFALAIEASAASWTLPDGSLALPRLVSHAADAPYLGEAAITYFLSVQPAPDVEIVPARGLPPLAWIGLLVFFGAPLAAWSSFAWQLRRTRSASPREEGERSSRADG